MEKTVPLKARRLSDIEPFYVMKILARAHELEREGRSVVHMEVGEPDFDTAAPIVEAGIRALRAGETHYTAAMGIAPLREAIADFYERRYSLDLNPHRVAVTPGATDALQLVLAALVDPGDEVILTDPGYPCNRHYVRMMEGRAVWIPVTAETGYQLTAELVEKHWTPKTKAVLVASPANPTGTMVAREEMLALSELTKRRGAALIVDEIYHGLTYGVKAESVLEINDEAFVINSFSKYFGMTGWRIGWLVAPDRFVEDIDKLAQNLVLAVSTPAQHAALAAFGDEAMAIHEERRATFSKRRDFLLPALKELGFKIPASPVGAFYLYADCSDLTQDSSECAARILEEVGVAVTPGKDFGSHRSSEHIRFAYTTSIENLREGVSRLERFLKSR